MAFTALQKDQIRRYLGYSGLYPQIDTVLEQAMNAIGADANAVADVATYIANCQAAEARLTVLLGYNDVTQGSASAAVDSIRGAILTRQQGRQYCGNIAAVMGVPCRHDYFSPTLANSAPSPGFNGSYVGMWSGGGSGPMRFG